MRQKEGSDLNFSSMISVLQNYLKGDFCNVFGNRPVHIPKAEILIPRVCEPLDICLVRVMDLPVIFIVNKAK